MSKRNNGGPPFKADHVGSLLRPERLLNARREMKAGNLDGAALKEIEDQCILEVIALQEDVGLQSITDGEFRRDIWHYDFLSGLMGIELVDAIQGPAFSGGQMVQSLAVTGKIENPNGVMIDHFKFLESNTTKTAKFCIPSPSIAYYRGGRALIDEGVYPDLESFWSDLCAAYADEIELLAAAGCTYLQLDDTTFAMFGDPKMRKMVEDRGDDADDLIKTFANSINRSIAARPADFAITVHMCRGNFRSQWLAEGGYEPVAERMFGGLEVDGFFMEWDSERAGGFEPLRFAPKDACIVLGLVTSKFPELESKDYLKRRIDEASKFVSLDQLCLSPQCGFASTHEGNKLSEDEERRKLELVVETAAEVWG